MGSARLVDIADCLALSPSSLLRSASFECTTARHTSDGIHSSLVLVGFNPRENTIVTHTLSFILNDLFATIVTYHRRQQQQL